MPRRELPSPAEIAIDLGKIARNGVGRSLPGQQTGGGVPHIVRLLEESDGAGSSDLSVRIANLVVRAARAIEPKSDREAVAAVLWIDLESSDGIMKTSPPLLEHRGGRYELAAGKLDRPTTEGNFKNHIRRPLLERVARNILSACSSDAGISRDTPVREPPDSEAQGSSLDMLALASATLYWNGLASLFVSDLDRYLPLHYPGGIYYWGTAGKSPWDQCCSEFFVWYVEWLVACHYALDPTSEDSEKTFLGWSPSSIEQLRQYVDDGVAVGPPGLRNVQIDKLLDLQTSDEAAEYNAAWWEWYEPAFPHLEAGEWKRGVERDYDIPDRERRKEVYKLLASVRRTYRLIAGNVKLSGPYFSNAREYAVKDTAHHYGLLDDPPIFRGERLLEAMRRFFEDIEIELDAF